MNALLVTLLFAAPIDLPMPTTVEESCDARALQPVLSAPAKQAMAMIPNIDRRIQIVLAAEREAEAVRGALPAAPSGRADMAVAGALLLVAVGLGLAASRRRSLAGVGAAWGLAAIGAAIAWRHIDQQASGVRERAALVEKQLALTQCRLQLNETRGLVQHSMLSKTIHDLDEVDEDLAGWEAKLRAGTPVAPEDLAKMRGEIQASLRP